MADHSDIRYKAGEAAGHAQIKKNEMMDKASGVAQSCKESCQQGGEKAGGFMQQAGEQVMQMAQGAADTVKNAVGMGGATGGGGSTASGGATTTTHTTTTKRY
uniref:Uncharacterized protein n=1 Tax=Ananas comosus var. bracteatus TaxID=296719 RepID=A0A6V7QKR5_ANACO|nr:unnamed protein product [Ananas comosus var. bracteatus]